MVSFEFNGRDFNRDLKRAVEEQANEGMREIARNLQRALDGLLRTHSGKPVDEVKPVLQAACRGIDFSLDTSELTAWSEAISEGTRIVVETQDVRL